MDIKPDRAVLKSYFAKNAVPTAGNFSDLVDGMINQREDGIVKLAGEPLSIQAEGNETSVKKAINFYRNFADPKPAWTLCLNPRADAANAATAKSGWSIGDGDGNSKLFIDQATGNVGVGTVEAATYKLSVNGSALFTGNYLYVNSENAGRLRVGATWGMPGVYSGDDGAKPLSLGVQPGQKVYLGVSNGDAYVEGGTGNGYFRGNVGIGTTGPTGKLHVQTNGVGGWDRFVVKTTNCWGDGENQYVTIGEGGATGIMIYNPHVVWYAPEARASIRLGRSGGWAGGHWWDVGVRGGNMFSIVDGQNGAFGLSINEGGTVKINVLQLGDRWRLSGVGDAYGSDDWLRLMNISNSGYYGGLAAGRLWASSGALTGSDLRMKTQVSSLNHAPDDILKLRGVRFKWRDREDAERDSMGLIAQEVEAVFPEAVDTGPNGMKGIDYAALIAPLIETVKRQQAQIDELKAEIGALKAHG